MKESAFVSCLQNYLVFNETQLVLPVCGCCY